MSRIQPTNPTELIEGSGSVQLPTNADPHPQVIELVNRVARSRLESTPAVSEPPQPPASGSNQ